MSTAEDRSSDAKLEVIVIPEWPDWYARYMVAAQAGTELPT
jgi:hypothetical protein